MSDSTFLTALGVDAYDGFGRIEDANPSQTTILLQKKREIQVLQRHINQTRDECDQRLRACSAREKLLEEKQTKIQEAIKRFDKFIQENDVKRSRAAQKERDERQERIAKEHEVAQLKKQLEDMQARRGRQKRELQMGKVYQRYLDTVVENSGGEFEEIEDALQRFSTLQSTMEDLEATQSRLNSQLEDVKAKLVLELKDTQDALLVATSSIARKQKDLENIRNLRMRLEQNLATQEEAKNQSISTTGEARRAIANIYLRCRKPNHPLLNAESEMTKVLEYIKFRCGDLKQVAALKSQAPEKKSEQKPANGRPPAPDNGAKAGSTQGSSSRRQGSTRRSDPIREHNVGMNLSELPDIAEEA